MRLRQFLADRHESGSHQAQAAAFETADDLADQSALDTIGLHKH
jgi:hypothetical protein